MIVYLLGGLVVYIGSTPPVYLEFDTVLPNWQGAASVGQVWNGSAFAAPVANSEQANRAALADQADAALAVNLQAISDAQAWIAANPGSLTTTVLSNAMRSVMNSLITATKQRNGVIRLLRGKLDATT